MKRAKAQKGNTLALVVVCIGVIAVLVAFFALNYGQFLGTHKRAQTAIDAAALQAARDIGRVVINDPRFGRVALCDDVPPGGDLNARPVWGLNTILGTARLDLLIANQLQNGTMVYLAKQDIANAQTAGLNLAATIMQATGQAVQGGTPQACNDKNGTPIAILQNATNAYNENSRRLGTGEMVPGTMKITVGQLTGGTAETNTPVPLPESLADVDSTTSMTNQYGQKVYKAYVEVPTRFGTNTNNPIIFAAVTDEPRLCDGSKFSPLGLTTNIPAVVKVEVDERVTTIAPGSNGQKQTATVHVSACAQAGGPRGTQPSGVMAVAFPQGMPPVAGTPVDFSSVKSVMNDSRLSPDAGGSTAAPTGNWNARGQWNQVVGGAFPSGTNGPTGNPTPANFNGRSAAGVDNASTSLAFLVYDWLRSCGLRPNIASVVAALELTIRDQANNRGTSQVVHDSFFMPPAYAQDESDDSIASGILAYYPPGDYDSTDPGTAQDPRLIGPHYNEAPVEYQEQFRTTMNSTDVGETFNTAPGGAQIRRTSYSNGNVVTVGGADIAVLNRLWDALGTQEQLSQKAFNAANGLAQEYTNLANEKLGQKTTKQGTLDNKKAARDALVNNSDPNDQDQIDALNAEIGVLEGEVSTLAAEEAALRAKAAQANVVKDNAVYVGETHIAIKTNIGSISGAGVTEISGGFQFFGDTPFIPVTSAPESKEALKQALDNNQDVPAGQGAPSSVNSTNKWNSAKDGNNKCTLITCRRAASPTIGHRPDGGGPFLPALAQSSVAQAGTVFIFIVRGDASRPDAAPGQPNLKGDGGKIKRICTFARQSHFAFRDHNLMEGQFIFNNPSAMRSQVPGNTAIRWSLNAFDWNATGATYRDQQGNQQGAGYSANVNENGYNVNPLNWCHLDQYTGGAGQGEGGNEPCYYPSGVWSFCCPDPEVPTCQDGSTPASRSVERADGTVAIEVDPCPPPPRRSH